MNRKSLIWAALAALLVPPVVCAQADRRQLASEFRLAEEACRAAVDSGSLAKALARLSQVAAQDPNYPGLKNLRERCEQDYKKQRNQEELLFEEAKSAYQRGALEDARVKFQSLAGRDTPHSTQAKSYLSTIIRTGLGAPAPASEQDYVNFEMAVRHFKAQNYDKARPLFEMLLGKGGNLALESRKYLDQMELRNKSYQLFQQGNVAYRQRRYQDALDIFLRIRQQDPELPGLAKWIADSQAGLGKTEAEPAESPAFQRGKNFFQQKDYAAALKVFQDLQSSRPDSPDVQAWIQKTESAMAEERKHERLNRTVREAQASLRRKEYARAHTLLRHALTLSPNNAEISALLSQAAAGMQQSGQTAETADRGAYLAAYLEDGIREFYSGNFAETARLLEQYVRENGKQAALACFYLGAVASTEFFLEGGKDQGKEERAQQWFAKSRQVNPKFEPPREWVSPKVIALFEKTASKP